MRSLIQRVKAAIAAFRAAQHAPAFAVIYDLCDGDPKSGAVISEEYYENFGTPAQAALMYRTAFPHKPVDPDGFNYANARLVLILGEIDEYDR